MGRQFDVPGLKALGLSPGDFASPVFPLKTVDVTLNNDEILADPTTAHVIIPATDTPNYTRLPTKLFWPISAYAVLDTLAAAYSIPSAVFLYWSGIDSPIYVASTVSVSFSTPMSLGQFQEAFSSQNKSVFFFFCQAGGAYTDTGAFYDNSLGVFISSSGALTGGDPANTLKIVVNYLEIDF